MAKTAADYRAAGAELAQAEILGATIDANDLIGDSWQAKAFQAGYDLRWSQKRANDHHEFVQGIVKKGADAAAQREAEEQADIAMREDRPVEHFGTPTQNAAVSHVRFLLDECERVRNVNPGRATRLHVKARALIARHGITATVQQAVARGG